MGSDRDSAIGANVMRLRGEMSQQAVADAMRERGHKWSQATVWSVEKGDRPLRFTEAEDLASVFRVMLQSLTMTPKDARVVQLVDEVAKAGEAVADAVARFEARHDTLSVELLAGGVEDPNVQAYGDRAESLTVEDAVEAGLWSVNRHKPGYVPHPALVGYVERWQQMEGGDRGVDQEA